MNDKPTHARLEMKSCLNLVLCTIVAIVLTFGLPGTVNAEGIQIVDIGSAIKAASEAFSTLAEGVHKATRLGLSTYDLVTLRKTAENLKSLSSSISALQRRREVLSSELHDYIEDPKPARWPIVRQEIWQVLSVSDEVIKRLNSERSNIILEPAYDKLNAAMGAKGMVLLKIQHLTAPTAGNEMTQLKQLSHSFDELIANIQRTQDELDEYIKKLQEKTHPL